MKNQELKAARVKAKQVLAAVGKTVKNKNPGAHRAKSDPNYTVRDFEQLMSKRERCKLHGLPLWLQEHGFKPGNQLSKGQGRPRTGKLSQAYRALLAEVEPESGLTYADLIAIGQIESAIVAGNTAAARELRESTEGKLPETFNVHHRLEDATDAELEQIIESYKERKADGD